ncbi:hypothetical protein ElyMa_004911800 [Elysia marginata]|uniref:Uncharacterized protein n=1 Tax=Elysia marginata TaxID=1093978 RepID=A0AAV4IW63_9GAST|nr:hypothetical protein ElyMa_004911800 [Elysia marginata]
MLPAINLGSVLESVDSHMSENRLQHRAHVQERRMHRNMEGFCIYQAYLRRLRSLHRAYVNRYKQLASKQGQSTSSSQSHRYQQHQQQRQQQQQLRWSFGQDGASFRQCSHLKCCHDEQRRKANLRYLGNKFFPSGVSVPSEECYLHEATPTRFTKKPEVGVSSFRCYEKPYETATNCRRFRMSHIINEGSSPPRSTPKFHEDIATSSACESFCSCGHCSPSLLPALPNKTSNLDDKPFPLQDEGNKHPRETVSCQIMSDPPAIRIPCGRDGSFCEPDSPPQIELMSLKLDKTTSPMKQVQSPIDREAALPFRVWKRRRDKLGGTFFSTANPSNLHHV